MSYADDLFIKNNNAIINNEALNLPKPYKEEQKKKGFLKKYLNVREEKICLRQDC